MSTFTDFNLDSHITKAIQACGYTNPTPVQAKAIPAVLEGQDVVVSAQTGTGKTAAFVLPALHNLSQQASSKKTRVLILTPTRELASQITKASGLYGKFLKFNIVSLVGGMPYHHQIRDLSRGADIIVATPGRLLDHMEQKRIDLSNIDMLILDEADRMLDMGFIDDVQYIAKLTPAKRQTLLFSATLDNKLMNAVRHLLKDPVRIDLSTQAISAPLIKQELYKVNSPHQKTRLLKHFLHDENIFKAIVFSATKIMADKLADQLSDEGFAAAPLHGDLRQNVRNRTLEALRRGKVQVLVATDVAARGLDVSDITHVFNYDLPRFCEDYVHRIGRTGRAGKEGVAISFVMPSDSRNVKSIERYIGKRINLINFDFAKLDSASSASKKEKFVDDGEVLSLGRSKKSFHESDEDFEERPKRTTKRREFSDSKDKDKISYGPSKKSFGKKRGFGERSERRSDDKPSFGAKRRSISSDNESSPFANKKKRSFGSESRGSESRERGGFGERSERRRDDKPAFGAKKRSFSGERRERDFGDKESSPFAKKKRSFGGESRGSESRERGGFGERSERRRDDKPAFGAKKRSFSGERRERDFGDNESSPFAKKKRSFGGESRGSESRERSSFGERSERRRDDKPAFGAKKKSFSGEKRERSFGDKKPSFGGKKKSFGERRERDSGERKSSNNPFDGTRRSKKKSD